jgi:transcriptional regulator with XRE-family HTH domain
MRYFAVRKNIFLKQMFGISKRRNNKIMIDNELKNITKQLPKGSISEIASRTKLSKTTISTVLQGKVNCKRKPEILKATAEYLAEYKAKEREAKEALQKAMNM